MTQSPLKTWRIATLRMFMLGLPPFKKPKIEHLIALALALDEKQCYSRDELIKRLLWHFGGKSSPFDGQHYSADSGVSLIRLAAYAKQHKADIRRYQQNIREREWAYTWQNLREMIIGIPGAIIDTILGGCCVTMSIVFPITLTFLLVKGLGILTLSLVIAFVH